MAHTAKVVGVVADEEEGEVVLAPHPMEHLQHYRLYRDVKRRRRLIQHQEARLACDGAGDADTGLLTAGQLMREARQQLRRQSDALRTLLHAFAQSVALAHAAKPQQRMGDAVKGRKARGEAVVRILEDNLDILAKR